MKVKIIFILCYMYLHNDHIYYIYSILFSFYNYLHNDQFNHIYNIHYYMISSFIIMYLYILKIIQFMKNYHHEHFLYHIISYILMLFYLHQKHLHQKIFLKHLLVYIIYSIKIHNHLNVILLFIQRYQFYQYNIYYFLIAMRI